MNHCDMGHSTSGETRRIPWQPGVEYSGASILCRRCHQKQAAEQPDTLSWEVCEVVEEATGGESDKVLQAAQRALDHLTDGETGPWRCKENVIAVLRDALGQ